MWKLVGIILRLCTAHVLLCHAEQLLVPELLEILRLVPTTDDTLEARRGLALALRSTASTFGRLEA